MPSVKQVQITFDCLEPVRVARFWAETLGYRAEFDDEQDGWAAAQDSTGAGPRLYFQRVPETKVVKNRVHLDVRVGTGLVGEERLAALETECERLLPLGARRVRLLYDGTDSCIVMHDVEGNEFCLD